MKKQREVEREKQKEKLGELEEKIERKKKFL